MTEETEKVGLDKIVRAMVRIMGQGFEEFEREHGIDRKACDEAALGTFTVPYENGLALVTNTFYAGFTVGFQLGLDACPETIGPEEADAIAAARGAARVGGVSDMLAEGAPTE